MYKSSIRKVVTEGLIGAALIYLLVFLGAGITIKSFIYATIAALGVQVIFSFVIYTLLRIDISDTRIIYRSDYGFTHRIPIQNIRKITLGRGVNRNEHALFIYHDSGSGEKRTKIKTSYFDHGDVVSFVSRIREKVNIETNPELDEYLSERK